MNELEAWAMLPSILFESSGAAPRAHGAWADSATAAPDFRALFSPPASAESFIRDCGRAAPDKI